MLEPMNITIYIVIQTTTIIQMKWKLYIRRVKTLQIGPIMLKTVFRHICVNYLKATNDGIF